MGSKREHGFDDIYIKISNATTGEMEASCGTCDFKKKIEPRVGGVKLTDFDQIAVWHAEHITCLKAYDRGKKFGKSGMFHAFAGQLQFTATPESAHFLTGLQDGLGRPLDIDREYNGVKDLVTVSW